MSDYSLNESFLSGIATFERATCGSASAICGSATCGLRWTHFCENDCRDSSYRFQAQVKRVLVVEPSLILCGQLTWVSAWVRFPCRSLFRILSSLRCVARRCNP
jgi:hypothetical protein